MPKLVVLGGCACASVGKRGIREKERKRAREREREGGREGGEKGKERGTVGIHAGRRRREGVAEKDAAGERERVRGE